MATNRLVADWYLPILQGVNPTGTEIGSGAYGRVFEVEYEGTLCAAKETHARQREITLKNLKDNFVKECHIWTRIWSTVHHPMLVHFLGMIRCSLSSGWSLSIGEYKHPSHLRNR